MATVSVLAIAGVGSVSGQENSVGVRYDLNGNNRIERNEVLAAIDDYLFTDLVTRDEVSELIDLYLFDLPVTTPTPVPLNPESLPPCTADRSVFPYIDLGIRLSGCHTERANIYLSDSSSHILPKLVASVDPLLKSLDDALLAQLNIDAAARGLPAIHLVNTPAELDAIKRYFNIDVEASGWYSCCGERPGIYGSDTSPIELIAHEYVHFALSDYWVPRWMDEGLAVNYVHELVLYDPTGSILWQASGAKRSVKEGQTLSLTDSDLNPYARGYMAVRYIIEIYGYPAMSRILELISEGSDASTAISRVVGKSYAQFEIDFTLWVLAWGENDPKYRDFLAPGSGALFCFPPSCAQIGQGTLDFLVDLSAEATFINPTQTNWFEYGFNIRDSIDINVTSEQYWRVTFWSREDRGEGVTHRAAAPIDGGELHGPFDTSPGGENHLRITAEGNRGCLYVNGEFISCFDLPEPAQAGSVLVYSKIGDVWFKDRKIEPASGSTTAPGTGPATPSSATAPRNT